MKETLKNRLPWIAVMAQVLITAIVITAFLLYTSSRQDEEAGDRKTIEDGAAATAPALGAPPPTQATFRGNNSRTGYFDSAASKERHGIKWMINSKYAFLSSPVASGGTVFFGADGTLVAFESATGRELWNIFLSSSSDGAPTVADGLIFLGGETLYAIDSASKETRWQLPGNFVGSPLVADGALYIDSQDGLMALDASTGASKWIFPHAAGGSGLNGSALADGVLYFTSRVPENNAGYLFAVSAATGTELWRIETSAVVIAAPAVSGGIVYVASYMDPRLSGDFDGQRDLFEQGQLQAVDATSGAQLWKYEAPAVPNLPVAVAGDTVFLAYNQGSGSTATGPGGVSGYLRAFDARTGAEKWAVERPYMSTPPSVAGKEVLAVISALNPQERRAQQFGAQSNLTAFDVFSGQESWSYSLESGQYGAAPFILDGVIYLSTDHGVVMAIE